MELVQFRAPRNKKFVLAPIGDLQWSGDAHEIAFHHLREHIDRMLDMDAWFIGLGDYIDFASPSNRENVARAGLYETTRKTISKVAEAHVEEVFQKILKRTKGRWIGLLEGHHWYPLLSGITSDQQLCQKLDARFLGTSAYIQVGFERNDKLDGSVRIWAHHGNGGGQSLTGGLNKLQALASEWPNVDIFLMGHTTKRGAVPLQRIVDDFRSTPPQLRHRDSWLINTGGWLKGYVEGAMEGNTPRGNYVERGMMRPVVLGGAVITITPKRTSEGDHFDRLIEVQA